MTSFAAFSIWTAAAVILSSKTLLLAGATAGSRAIERRALNPEDDADEVVSVDGGRTGRIGRAHRNALENIPLFLVISLAWVSTDPSLTWAMAIFGLFTLARVAHTVVYLAGVSKPRSGMFAIGWFTTFTMMGHMAWSVFRQ